MCGRAVVERDLPKNVEAEQAILGSAILEPEAALPTLVEMLDREHFYRDAHRVIFGTICELFDRGEPVDIIAVANRLEEKEETEKAGGRSYLNELLNRVISTTSLEYYTDIVRKKATLRVLIKVGGEISELGYQEQHEPMLLLTRAQELLSSISKNGAGQYNTHISTWQDLRAIVQPVTWCWDKWLPNGMLTLLAGEAGSGKSSLALRIAASFLRGDPWPDSTPYSGETGLVLWCECEAAQAMNLDRAQKWGLPLESLINPVGDPMASIALDDPVVFMKLRSLASSADIRLIVIDSLSGAHRQDENAADTVHIVLSLAALARDTAKPVLLTHHLRKKSKFESEEVTLERLRGSSAIVQPARAVWALDTPNGSLPKRRRLSMIKNNLSKFAPPLGLEINDEGVLFCEAPERPHIETQVGKAADLLMALLRRDRCQAFT